MQYLNVFRILIYRKIDLTDIETMTFKLLFLSMYLPKDLLKSPKSR